jgi:ABC-type sugar transport system substrate-binding protein
MSISSKVRKALFLAALTTSLPAGSALAQSGVWLIGEVAPLTGPGATVGTRLNKSTKMWVEQINAAGGIAGRKVELITCNDEVRPEKAVACVRDMLGKGVMMIFGNTLTASIRAMEPLVAKGPVMLVPSPNIVPPASSFMFQVSPSDHAMTIVIADFMKANGIERLGMVAATDASGEAGVASAREVMAQRKLDLRLARIDLRATDATTQLATVAGNDVKLIYSSYTGAGAAARLLGTGLAALSPELVQDPASRKRSQDFLAQYEKTYNEKPDQINLLGKLSSDTAEAVFRNVKDPTDAAAVKAFLESGAVIPSVHSLKFSVTSHVGLTENDVRILEYKSGFWKKADAIK